ncbi:MAG: uncharacterized protein QOF84_6504 [Streptomyces sp.]|nr:uncharacterized protein [Streptomyces sp.]
MSKLTPGEESVSWQELTADIRGKGLPGHQLYLVLSEATNGPAAVLANREPHLAYQMRLESEGVLFVAGPLAGEDGQSWDGSGAFVYRAPSLERAREIAGADPMHVAGARRFRIMPWLVTEGSVSVRLFFSGAAPRLVP